MMNLDPTENHQKEETRLQVTTKSSYLTASVVIIYVQVITKIKKINFLEV